MSGILRVEICRSFFVVYVIGRSYNKIILKCSDFQMFQNLKQTPIYN